MFLTEPAAMNKEFLNSVFKFYGVFKPLRTILLFSTIISVSFILTVAGFLATMFEMNGEYRCRAYYKLIYGQVGLWILTLTVGYIMRDRHHKLRMNGYFEFYNKTRILNQLPMYIVSAATTLTLLVDAISQDAFAIAFQERCDATRSRYASPVTYFTVILGMELVFIIPIGYVYIFRVYKFNKLAPPPDAQKEEWKARSSARGSAQRQLGQSQLGGVYDFVSKQADMIQSLRETNARLIRTKILLEAQMNATS